MSQHKYRVTVTDASTDPVIIDIAIRGVAQFKMEIPKEKYDGVSILEIIERMGKP